MKQAQAIFVDTSFLIALFDRRDRWHGAAMRARAAVGTRPLVTTDAVLTEFLNYMSDQGDLVRERACEFVRDLLDRPLLASITPTRQSFDSALRFYRERGDKSYSLTDCLSMLAMRERGVGDVLTTDRHFGQEGFHNLIEMQGGA